MTGKQNRQNSKKIALGAIGAAILIFVVVPLVSLLFIMDSYPLVLETASVDVNSAAKAKNIVKQVHRDFMEPDNSNPRSILVLSENDINGIIALAMRGIKGLKGRVNVTAIGIKGAFTFSFPSNPFGNYINITGTIIPSKTGLVIDELAIGNVELSGDLAISFAENLLNRLLSGKDTGTRLINSIESVTVYHSQITLIYRAIPNMKQIFKETKGQMKNLRDDLALMGDPKLVKIYYQKLCDFNKQVTGIDKVNVPLGLYLSTAFTFAKERYLISENPIDENRASLLALAIFLGSNNFDSVVGSLDMVTLRKCQLSNSKVVLANRNDLRLHFIYSAALKVISDSGMSFAIGEFKELLDSQDGGSGFSFADLAADRAGIRFAELALDRYGALRIQNMAQKLTEEKIFFPSIEELPEGIPQHMFEKRGGIESDYYKKYLNIINERIDNLPLYHSRK